MCEEEYPTRHITTRHTYTTEFNADSVEWCPHDPFQNILVCANYQLKDKTDKPERFGCILLFSIDASLHLRQTIKTAGVLDQKWCHNLIGNRPILGVVTADNSLEIYDLNAELVELGLVARYKLDDNALLLSLDWSTGRNKSEEPQIVCSDSKGRIHLFRFKYPGIRHERTFQGHDFEAWIAAFYYWDPNVFFSGGDDCRFLKFDQRTGLEPISSNNKSHEAGVTSMHSNPMKENILATGSYDSNIRIWDIRKMKNCINSIKVPGTLWRLKFDPFSSNFLLAACMLGGVHIVDSTNFETLQIIDSYYQHKNIAYGADWSHLSNLIASCSFYDNLLCISEVKLGSDKVKDST